MCYSVHPTGHAAVPTVRNTLLCQLQICSAAPFNYLLHERRRVCLHKFCLQTVQFGVACRQRHRRRARVHAHCCGRAARCRVQRKAA